MPESPSLLHQPHSLHLLPTNPPLQMPTGKRSTTMHSMKLPSETLQVSFSFSRHSHSFKFIYVDALSLLLEFYRAQDIEGTYPYLSSLTEVCLSSSQFCKVRFDVFRSCLRARSRQDRSYIPRSQKSQRRQRLASNHKTILGGPRVLLMVVAPPWRRRRRHPRSRRIAKDVA